MQLDQYGKARLAMNYIAAVKKLRLNVGYLTKCIKQTSFESAENTVFENVWNIWEGIEEALMILNKISLSNINRIIIGPININSIRNSFGMLSNIINNNIDILMVSETKLESSFLNAVYERRICPSI